jgi:hypothetical protein
MFIVYLSIDFEVFLMTFVVFSDVSDLSIDFEVYCDVSIDLGLGFYWLW